MRLHVLDIKLVRDVRRLWVQALAIALVLACGVAIFVTGFSMHRALVATRADYYSANLFGDVFASARRAPVSLAKEIRAISGIRAVEVRIGGAAILDLPDRAEAAQARIVSLPEAREPDVNLPRLVSGRLPEENDEVAVTDRFARANGFRPGESFSALLGGTLRQLRITGTVVTPEYIYTLAPGGMMPDDHGFGVLFMPERAAAAAFGLTGAFNEVALTLQSWTDRLEVIDRLDTLLAPWGGTGAYGREHQLSNAFIDAEIQQLASMATVLPPIFFGIAAFLVNMVLGRIVALERAEIGLLKALGYFRREILAHYLMLAGLIAAMGVIIGWCAGNLLARGMVRLYARFYDFPWIVRPQSSDIYACAALLGLAAASLGALRAAFAAARLDPAVAMSPPAPTQFRASAFDRAARALRLSQPTMMILRSLTRWPVRSGFTVVGFGFGVAVLVAAGFFATALDRVIDISFFRQNRQHATLILSRAEPLSVIQDVLALPGVLDAEPQLDQPAILRLGPRKKRVAISGRSPGADLARLLDAAARTVVIPPDGLVLSEQLARQIGARPGDIIELEMTGEAVGTVPLRVADIVTQYTGLGAYMDLGALAAVLRKEPRANAVNLALDPAQASAFHAAVKATPRIESAVMLTKVRDSFRETIEGNIAIMSTVYITMAVLITLGLAYNGARIQLSERARELASLRILGFTRAEVSWVLLGETAVLVLLAQPVGWLIGAGIAWTMVNGFESDLYRLPFTLRPAMFAKASLIALAVTFAAALIVRRRLDRADLVAVMKTRE